MARLIKLPSKPIDIIIPAPVNLTGPITSVGNATSIASQTGTGNTFAMSASPTFTGTVNAAAITASGVIQMSAGSSSSAALQFSANAGTGIYSLSSGLAMAFTCQGTVNSAFGANSFNINNGVFFGFSSGDPAVSSADVNLSRNASGVMQLGTTVKNASGSLLLTNLTASGSITSTSATAGIGYATGSGGTVTQITSRTTPVTINKVCGAITLVSAAGSATTASFTITNSTVSATDIPRVCQKSGTDKYRIDVTAVANGSFEITFATTGGTTTEQPVFSFDLGKAVTS
jgi:hypothetical protein